MRIRTMGWLTVATAAVLLSAPALRAQECDDSDPCTVNDMCGTDGECHGTPQAGKSCDDHDDCTVNDRCQSGGCMGDPGTAGTVCGGGCGTCQQLVPVAGVPLSCSGNTADSGKACDPGVGNCVIGQCQIVAGIVAFCSPQLKQCPTSSGCKGFCNFQTGECDASLSQCIPNCERCNTATNTCEPTNIGAACDDSNVCTTQSSCQAVGQRGVCLAGTPSASSPTPTATLTGPTPTVTATSTATVGSPTPTRTTGVPPTPGPCVGDCNGSHSVAINEIIECVNIALDTALLSTCSPCSANGSTVQITDLISAVNSALNGCV